MHLFMYNNDLFLELCCLHCLLWGCSRKSTCIFLRQSPIFFAPTRQVCELLMFRKADLVSSNSKKQTPLHLAAHAGLHEAAACLLETFQSSALELEDVSGHSPLLYAAKSKVKSIHAFLQGLRTEGKLEEATHYPADDGEKQQIAVPPVDLEKTQGEKMKETLQTPQTKCPEGHDLVPFESEEDDFLCSVCDCEFPMGTILYGCRSCDYDLCRECLAHTVFHASGKSFVTAFPEMQTTFQSYGTSNQSILQGAGKTCLILLPSWWESGLRWDPDMLNC